MYPFLSMYSGTYVFFAEKIILSEATTMYKISYSQEYDNNKSREIKVLKTISSKI